MKLRILIFLLLIVFPIIVFADQKNSCPQSKGGSEHGNLGTKYWQMGNFESAEKETKMAIEIDPYCSMWYQNLGIILESEGKSDEAFTYFQKSLQVDNYWCTAYKTGSLLAVGNYSYKKRKYQESIDYLNKAIIMAEKENIDKKTLSYIYCYLSFNYTDSKEDGNPFYDLKKAEIYKKKALELNPEDLFLRASFAKLYILQDMIDKAKQSISEIIEKENSLPLKNPVIYAYIAHMYSLLKDPEQSAFYIKKAIELNPRYGAEYLLGELERDFKYVANSKEMQPVIDLAKKIVDTSGHLRSIVAH